MKTKISILGLGALAALFLQTSAQAASLTEKSVEYRDGDQVFEGFLAMPSTVSKRGLPGVLIVHNWMGVSDETKSKARSLAQLGYIAFAAVVYGKGVRPKNADEASKLASKFRDGDRTAFRKNLQAGLKALSAVPGVDPARLGAMGYCFGGTGAIELGRSGAALKGIVSFHGGLDSPIPADGKNIKAKVLALHGADDPYVPAKNLAAFEDEMRSNKIDWQLVKYGNAVHSFTEKGAGNDNSKGAAYNADADRRSWAEMERFWKETL